MLQLSPQLVLNQLQLVFLVDLSQKVVPRQLIYLVEPPKLQSVIKNLPQCSRASVKRAPTLLKLNKKQVYSAMMPISFKVHSNLVSHPNHLKVQVVAWQLLLSLVICSASPQPRLPHLEKHLR